MKLFSVFVLLLVANGTLSAQSSDLALILEAPVQVERVKRKEHEGGATTPEGHRFKSTLPVEIATKVRELTSIPCAGLRATVRVVDENESFGMIIMDGQGFAAKGETVIGGKTLIPKHDFSHSFEEIFQVSNSDSLVAEGVYEFSNNLTKKQVYVVCRIRAKRGADGTFKSSSEWTGPIVSEKHKLNHLSILFRDSKQPD